MRWNTVLFDLDGTVTDPKEGITCAVAYALRQQGIIADPDTLTPFIGPPLHESFPELFGLTEEQTDRAVEDFRVYFSRQGCGGEHPLQGHGGVAGEPARSRAEAGHRHLQAGGIRPTHHGAFRSGLILPPHPWGAGGEPGQRPEGQRGGRRPAPQRRWTAPPSWWATAASTSPAPMKTVCPPSAFSTATAAGRNWKTPEPTIWPPIFTSSSSFLLQE